MNETHVVLGTGAVGAALIEQLVLLELPVRAVNRSGHADVADTVEMMAGDVSDPAFAETAAADSAVVYQCLNPPYHRWAEEFPPLQDSAVRAARANRARYVSFENTYMYGDTHGEPMTEASSMRAHTRKGLVRQAMAEQLRGLADRGDLDLVTVRASDYFGPRATAQSPLGDLVIGAALAGKPARVIGDPDQPHSYTYTIDAARTLAAVGTAEDVVGEVFHVPNARAQTTRQIIAIVAAQLGSPIKISVAPRLALRALGLFNPTIRELDEMRYEFTQPFVIDSSKAERRLGIEPTPLEDAIAVTIDWFQRNEPTA